MLIWMCALHCEAKPIIDFFRLKKSSDAGEFDLYQNKNIACIVSGIGATKMATATLWATEHRRLADQPSWINLGIAGHKNLSIGSTVLASKITSEKKSSKYYPRTDIEHDFDLYEVTSFSTQQSEYPDTAVCDMEAYAFIQTASQYSPLENCHCIKIISDNSASPAHKDKPRISALIATNMKAISRFADKCHQSVENRDDKP